MLNLRIPWPNIDKLMVWVTFGYDAFGLHEDVVYGLNFPVIVTLLQVNKDFWEVLWELLLSDLQINDELFVKRFDSNHILTCIWPKVVPYSLPLKVLTQGQSPTKLHVWIKCTTLAYYPARFCLRARFLLFRKLLLLFIRKHGTWENFHRNARRSSYNDQLQVSLVPQVIDKLRPSMLNHFLSF